jgi:hypothetical protein
MKIIRFAIVLAVLISAIGCGGGNNSVLPPSERDLNGLEGIWTVNLSYSGTLNTPSGSQAVSDSATGTWNVTRNAIQSGFELEWSYNGTTLQIHWVSTSGDWSSECGTILTTADVSLTINISPGATSAPITGTGTMTRQTEKCGTSSGNLIYSGNLVIS